MSSLRSLSPLFEPHGNPKTRASHNVPASVAAEERLVSRTGDLVLMVLLGELTRGCSAAEST